MVAVAVAVAGCEEREELGKLLSDQVLASVNGGHLSSDGVHGLTQGNSVLLRLVPIGLNLCGKRMTLICEGLSRTRGDLKVSVLRVACNGCGCWDIIVSLITRLVLAPELCPRQRYRKALMHLLLRVHHQNPGQLA